MADPGALAANLLQKHFPKFGSFRRFCTYKSMGDSAYATNTGVVTPVVLQTASVWVIFTEFGYTATMAAAQQRDEEAILSIDRNAIFPALDLPFTPRINDTLVDDQGTEWHVVAMSKDPKPAHHGLHVRPVK